MSKKAVSILIIVACVVLFAVLCVTTFANFDSFKNREYTVYYTAKNGGRVEGAMKQTVLEGADCSTVTAVPNEGYAFLKWADTGSLEPTRTDTNVNKNFFADAVFVKKSSVICKIMLVYVTEVQATLSTIDGTSFVADYKMNEKEIALCHAITKQVEAYMNEMLDGLVTFEIDEYFTQNVVCEENIVKEVEHDKNYYSVWAESLSEPVNVTDEYRCVITTFCFNDPDDVLYAAAGQVAQNSGVIDFSGLLPYRNSGMIGSLLPDQDLIDAVLSDFSSVYWRNNKEFYADQIITALDIDSGIYQQDSYMLTSASMQGDVKEAFRKNYLRNEAESNGKKVGIPLELYTDKVFTLIYRSENDCGSVVNMKFSERHQQNSLTLRIGSNSNATVCAIPKEGYRFVKWSDGVVSQIRKDTDLLGNMEVIAYFEPVEQ